MSDIPSFLHPYLPLGSTSSLVSIPYVRPSLTPNGDETDLSIKPKIPVSIQDLPNDVLSLVFANLPYVDLQLDVRAVCRSWNGIVSASKSGPLAEALFRYPNPRNNPTPETFVMTKRRRIDAAGTSVYIEKHENFFCFVSHPAVQYLVFNYSSSRELPSMRNIGFINPADEWTPLVLWPVSLEKAFSKGFEPPKCTVGIHCTHKECKLPPIAACTVDSKYRPETVAELLSEIVACWENGRRGHTKQPRNVIELIQTCPDSHTMGGIPGGDVDLISIFRESHHGKITIIIKSTTDAQQGVFRKAFGYIMSRLGM